MEMHAGTHHVVQMWGLSFNMDTLYMTWLTMAIILIIAFFATRQRKMVPTGLQNGVEMVLEIIGDQLKGSLGEHFNKFSSLLFTFFFFIFISNELGLIPSPHILVSPTSDLNTTLGLAIASSVSIWLIGLRVKGVGYLKHFFQPFVVFVIFHLMEEISKPVTLSFRLFGNIIAGEIVLELLNSLAPYLTPIIWLVFSLFVGIVQAFVFTILTTAYLGMAVADEH
ncbi:F0F1 ATP synthase subunit A [uncultured Veillonella sp.]|uniref:F0F1 ATP synthase subunit A n=1 Tax=uncultured Veillonella sp. TaxID=159268 RepID=UPI0025FA49CC|nr:F0F1 ATP synthase subunit A [uncultured Veillonella sp.]MDY3974637.1 F0F1 ATP synthase subunit A [Veillonella caviae]